MFHGLPARDSSKLCRNLYSAFGRSGNSASDKGGGGADETGQRESPRTARERARRRRPGRTKHEDALVVDRDLAANHEARVVLAHLVVAEVPGLHVAGLELADQVVDGLLALVRRRARRRLGRQQERDEDGRAPARRLVGADAVRKLSDGPRVDVRVEAEEAGQEVAPRDVSEQWAKGKGRARGRRRTCPGTRG